MRNVGKVPSLLAAAALVLFSVAAFPTRASASELAATQTAPEDQLRCRAAVSNIPLTASSKLRVKCYMNLSGKTLASPGVAGYKVAIFQVWFPVSSTAERNTASNVVMHNGVPSAGAAAPDMAGIYAGAGGEVYANATQAVDSNGPSRSCTINADPSALGATWGLDVSCTMVNGYALPFDDSARKMAASVSLAWVDSSGNYQTTPAQTALRTKNFNQTGASNDYGFVPSSWGVESAPDPNYPDNWYPGGSVGPAPTTTTTTTTPGSTTTTTIPTDDGSEDGDSDCAPSGWSWFSPSAYVSATGCLLHWAFVPTTFDEGGYASGRIDDMKTEIDSSVVSILTDPIELAYGMVTDVGDTGLEGGSSYIECSDGPEVEIPIPEHDNFVFAPLQLCGANGAFVTGLGHMTHDILKALILMGAVIAAYRMISVTVFGQATVYQTQVIDGVEGTMDGPWVEV